MLVGWHSHLTSFSCSYLRVSELARWRMLAATGFLSIALQKNWMFLIAKQHVTYKKSIQAFQNYTVFTSLSTSENKWLHYRQSFLCPKNEECAVVEVTAVLKGKDGKTIRIDEVALFKQ